MDENYNNQLQKTKKVPNLQKKKQNEIKKRKALLRKQNEMSEEIKQYERKQKRKKLIDDVFGLVRFFELATTNEIYVNSLNLHENKNELFIDCLGDFETIGSMLIGRIE